MLIAERHARLKDLISRRGMCPLDVLAGELGVSQSTVRRDLEMLESDGHVKRTHGGAIWVGAKPGQSRSAYAFDQQMDQRVEQKRRIARAAAGLVQPGQTIFIDGGTTTFCLAEQLAGMSLQLVTNSLPIANLFLSDERMELVVTGGVLYPRYGVLLGPAARSGIEAVHTQTLFLSAVGIHQGAVYNQNSLMVEAERIMMRQAQQVVLLADSTKFGRQDLARLADLSEIDVVVSDDELPQAARDEVAAAGCRLIIG